MRTDPTIRRIKVPLPNVGLKEDMLSKLDWLIEHQIAFGCEFLGETMPYGADHASALQTLRAVNFGSKRGADSYLAIDVHEDHAVDLMLRWGVEDTGRPPSMARFMDIMNAFDEEAVSDRSNHSDR